tara:strand:- start:33 stop:293 length:261 start_codon:yes stop_codon:yes gene_type:complete
MRIQELLYVVSPYASSEAWNIVGGILIDPNLQQVFYEREKILLFCYLKKELQSFTLEQDTALPFLIFMIIFVDKTINRVEDLLQLI